MGPSMDLEALYRLDLAPAIQRLLCCPGLDLPMTTASVVGEGWALALLVVAFAWKTNSDRRGAIRCSLRGATILITTGLLVAAIKHLIQAPRPLRLLGPEQVRVLLEPLHLMSFPSGHAAAAAALAMWAAREPSDGLRVWPWLLALLVGLSRVYVGAHWVIDVVVGWLVGVAVAAVVGSAWPRLRPVPTAVAEASEGDPCR